MRYRVFCPRCNAKILVVETEISPPDKDNDQEETIVDFYCLSDDEHDFTEDEKSFIFDQSWEEPAD